MCGGETYQPHVHGQLKASCESKDCCDDLRQSPSCTSPPGGIENMDEFMEYKNAISHYCDSLWRICCQQGSQLRHLDKTSQPVQDFLIKLMSYLRTAKGKNFSVNPKKKQFKQNTLRMRNVADINTTQATSIVKLCPVVDNQSHCSLTSGASNQSKSQDTRTLTFDLQQGISENSLLSTSDSSKDLSTQVPEYRDKIQKVHQTEEISFPQDRKEEISFPQDQIMPAHSSECHIETQKPKTSVSQQPVKQQQQHDGYQLQETAHPLYTFTLPHQKCISSQRSESCKQIQPNDNSHQKMETLTEGEHDKPENLLINKKSQMYSLVDQSSRIDNESAHTVYEKSTSSHWWSNIKEKCSYVEAITSKDTISHSSLTRGKNSSSIDPERTEDKCDEELGFLLTEPLQMLPCIDEEIGNLPQSQDIFPDKGCATSTKKLATQTDSQKTSAMTATSNRQVQGCQTNLSLIVPNGLKTSCGSAANRNQSLLNIPRQKAKETQTVGTNNTFLNETKTNCSNPRREAKTQQSISNSCLQPIQPAADKTSTLTASLGTPVILYPGRGFSSNDNSLASLASLVHNIVYSSYGTILKPLSLTSLASSVSYNTSHQMMPPLSTSTADSSSLRKPLAAALPVLSSQLSAGKPTLVPFYISHAAVNTLGSMSKCAGSINNFSELQMPSLSGPANNTRNLSELHTTTLSEPANNGKNISELQMTTLAVSASNAINLSGLQFTMQSSSQQQLQTTVEQSIPRTTLVAGNRTALNVMSPMNQLIITDVRSCSSTEFTGIGQSRNEIVLSEDHNSCRGVVQEIKTELQSSNPVHVLQSTEELNREGTYPTVCEKLFNSPVKHTYTSMKPIASSAGHHCDQIEYSEAKSLPGILTRPVSLAISEQQSKPTSTILNSLLASSNVICSNQMCDVDNVSRSSICDVDSINKNSICDVDKVNTSNICDVDNVNNSSICDVDKDNNSSICDVDKDNNSSICDVDKDNNSSICDVDKVKKDSICYVDKIRRSSSSRETFEETRELTSFLEAEGKKLANNIGPIVPQEDETACSSNENNTSQQKDKIVKSKSALVVAGFSSSHHRRLVCPVCHVVFLSSMDLLVHRFEQHGHVCGECDSRFLTLSRLKQHKESAHPPVLFCSQCRFHTFTKGDLMEHTRSHGLSQTKDEKLVCQLTDISDNHKEGLLKTVIAMQSPIRDCTTKQTNSPIHTRKEDICPSDSRCIDGQTNISRKMKTGESSEYVKSSQFEDDELVIDPQLSVDSSKQMLYPSDRCQLDRHVSLVNAELSKDSASMNSQSSSSGPVFPSCSRELGDSVRSDWSTSSFMYAHVDQHCQMDSCDFLNSSENEEPRLVIDMDAKTSSREACQYSEESRLVIDMDAKTSSREACQYSEESRLVIDMDAKTSNRETDQYSYLQQNLEPVKHSYIVLNTGDEENTGKGGPRSMTDQSCVHQDNLLHDLQAFSNGSLEKSTHGPDHGNSLCGHEKSVKASKGKDRQNVTVNLSVKRRRATTVSGSQSRKKKRARNDCCNKVLSPCHVSVVEIDKPEVDSGGNHLIINNTSVRNNSCYTDRRDADKVSPRALNPDTFDSSYRMGVCQVTDSTGNMCTQQNTIIETSLKCLDTADSAKKQSLLDSHKDNVNNTSTLMDTGHKNCTFNSSENILSVRERQLMSYLPPKKRRLKKCPRISTDCSTANVTNCFSQSLNDDTLKMHDENSSLAETVPIRTSAQEIIEKCKINEHTESENNNNVMNQETATSDSTTKVDSKWTKSHSEISDQGQPVRLTGHRFQCPVSSCKVTFCRRWNMKDHMTKVHAQNSLIVCSVSGCDLKFSNKRQLRQHVTVDHMGKTRKYMCSWPDCSKGFFARTHLSIHMLTHTGEKPVACDICDYRCRQRTALIWHLRKHGVFHKTGKVMNLRSSTF